MTDRAMEASQALPRGRVAGRVEPRSGTGRIPPRQQCERVRSPDHLFKQLRSSRGEGSIPEM
jgi:hypothetical protein